MRRWAWLHIFVLVFVFLSGQRALADDHLKQILDQIDDLYRGRVSSHGRLTMRVVTSRATRELTMENWCKGSDRFLMRILAPERERDTATLKIGDNVWNYFPKIKQITKLSASMMSGSWMGSHVTTGELVKYSRMSRDYTYSKTAEGTRAGEATLELTLMPKPDAAVVWGKIVAVVRARDGMPMVMSYFDEGLALSQTLTFADLRTFGQRVIPATMRFTPANKPKEYTELRFEALAFEVPLEDSLFSQRNLQRD